MMRYKGAKAFVSTCYDLDCQDDSHWVDTWSEVGRMVYIRKHVQYKGNGCHEWRGKYKRGYPVMETMQGSTKKYYTSVRRFNHHVEYALPDEPYETNGLTVFDTCGNHKCVNPDHMRTNEVEKEPEESMGSLVLVKIKERP